MAKVKPVVIAIVGNPLISGVPTASAFARVSLLAGSPETSSTTLGTVSARISGGCTIGPKRLRRWTAQIAATEPTK
jgi:hypothetical protein